MHLPSLSPLLFVLHPFVDGLQQLPMIVIRQMQDPVPSLVDQRPWPTHTALQESCLLLLEQNHAILVGRILLHRFDQRRLVRKGRMFWDKGHAISQQLNGSW